MNHSQQHCFSSKIGILLVNIGTPAAPTPIAVRRYLAEFLSDRRVVEIPKPLWQPILHGLVLPFRSKRSACLYKHIWTAEGSPLLVISNRQAQSLQHALERRYSEQSIQVALAMRYGKPSLKTALKRLQAWGMQRLLVFPLYPQYAAATTGSAFDAVSRELSRWRFVPEWRLINGYHRNEGYIHALARSIQQYWQQHPPGEKLLFSFHGLPERSRESGDPYYEQCHHTAQLIAEQLQLSTDRWRVVFQSRFGRTVWLQPYCDQTLQQLAKQGIRRVDICCPGFAADCLETLEEIAITNKIIFEQAGGEAYHYIAALNDSEEHTTCLADIASRHLVGWAEVKPNK